MRAELDALQDSVHGLARDVRVRRDKDMSRLTQQRRRPSAAWTI